MVCNNCNQEYEYFKNYCPNCGFEISYENKTTYRNIINNFKKRDIFIIILCEIFSLGFYGVYWFNENIKVFNKFTINNKISKKIITLYLLLTIMSDIVIMGILLLTFLNIIKIDIKLLTDFNIFHDTIGYITIIICFQFKWIYENNLRNIFKEFHMKLSGVLIFFFSIFYLQYKINCILENDQDIIDIR